MQKRSYKTCKQSLTTPLSLTNTRQSQAQIPSTSVFIHKSQQQSTKNSPRQSQRWCHATDADRVDDVWRHSRALQQLTRSTRRLCCTTVR